MLRLFRGVLGLLILLSLSACSSLAYYAQSVKGQLDLLNRSQSIEQLLVQDTLSESLRQRLERVLVIRQFASTSLLLPDNGSYRSYAELNREAVVWSVVATPEFSVVPNTWCYPIIGCASYRGYFAKEAALNFSHGLEAEGADVTVNPVPAYSTLGWFDDPVTSSFMHWPEDRVAGLIFHELAHQQLYVKGDSAFNEAFATAVQRIGVERWLGHQQDQLVMQRWQDRLRRQNDFVALLLETRNQLAVVYARDMDASTMRTAKQEIFDQLQSRYQRLKGEWGGYAGYDAWFSRPLNNARLASIATYEAYVPGFLAIADDVAGDMLAFYRACEVIAALPAEKRLQRLQSYSDRQTNTGQ